MWDLSSPTRYWTYPCLLYWKHGVLATGPPGKSLSQSFICDGNHLSLSLPLSANCKKYTIFITKISRERKIPTMYVNCLATVMGIFLKHCICLLVHAECSKANELLLETQTDSHWVFHAAEVFLSLCALLCSRKDLRLPIHAQD